MNIEKLITWALTISVIGIVLVIVLRELNVFTEGIFTSVANLLPKIATGIASVFKILFGWTAKIFAP